MRYLLALLVAFCALPASAGEQEWKIGEPYPVKTVACDTADQMRRILASHRDHGQQAGLSVYMAYNINQNAKGEPICGPVTGVWKIVRVIETTTLENRPMNLVEAYGGKDRPNLYLAWRAPSSPSLATPTI